MVTLHRVTLSQHSTVQGTTDLTDFEEPVERNPGEQNVGEKFDQWEDAVDNPVCQPLRVVVFVCRLYCLHTTDNAKAAIWNYRLKIVYTESSIIQFKSIFSIFIGREIYD